jgi:chromosome segregation ATPase
MPEEKEVQPAPKRGGNAGLAIGIVAIALLFAAAGYLISDLRNRVRSLEGEAARQSAESKVIEEKVHLTNKSIEDGMQALGSKVGMTQEELAARTAELKSQQSQQERMAAKLAAEQQATKRQVADVNSEVSGVKSELGGAQSDIASTRTDLASTNAKLETAMGDLNLHSGLIAKNHDDLEYLKHKGDRNYYEFTLKKKERRPISTVSLELKKTDPKRSRFTLDVYSDDHTLEKKDRTLGEPMQFYTGRDRQLYEVVVFDMTKDEISGYLSTPK